MRLKRTVFSWRLPFLILIALLAVLLPARPTAAYEILPNYLALGDSVPFGYSPLLDRTNANNFVGYPEVVGNVLDLRVANIACPGETSSGFLSLTGPDNGCRLYRALYPLHVQYTTTQAAMAVATLRTHPGTKLVTLTIGADDVFLLKAQCHGSPICVLQGLPALLATVTTNLTTIYSDIRNGGRYQGRLVALTYYSTNYNDPTTTQVIKSLNQTITSATLAAGGTIADGFSAFQTASAPSGDPCVAGLLIPLTTNPLTCDVHPTPKGRNILATAIINVVH